MTPEGLGYAAAWVLAAVFATEGIAKAVRPTEVTRQFTAMRLRSPGVAARVLPLCELAVAVALVTVPWVGAVGALALLAAFTVVLVRLLRSGFTEPCACFGGAARRAVSAADVARNSVLMGGAILVLRAEVVRPTTSEIVVVVVWAGLVAAALALIRVRLPPRRRAVPSRGDGPPRSV